MDQAADVNCENQISEIGSEPRAEQVAMVMDSNESTASTILDKRTRNVKNTTRIEKSQNDLVKKRKVAPVPETKSLKIKATHPPTSAMVIDSIKALKKRNGASFEDISKHMEDKYAVNMKVLKSHVNKFLQKSIDNKVLEKTDGADGRIKYKIKKQEYSKKDSQNLRRKEGNGKQKKKVLVTKKQAKM